MARYGAADAWIYVDGYDLTPYRVQGMEYGSDSELADDTGISDTGRKSRPLGLESAELSITGGVWDDTTGGTVDSLVTSRPDTNPNGTPRVVLLGERTTAIGKGCWGFEGTFQSKVNARAALDDMLLADAEFVVSGKREDAVVLQNPVAQTAAWNTEGANSVDNGASSANGGAGFLHVLSLSGFTAIDVKIRHSADDVTYTDLLAFTQQTSAPAAERKTVSGTVQRHLAVSGTPTGASGSVTVVVAFARA